MVSIQNIVGVYYYCIYKILCYYNILAHTCIGMAVPMCVCVVCIYTLFITCCTSARSSSLGYKCTIQNTELHSVTEYYVVQIYDFKIII